MAQPVSNRFDFNVIYNRALTKQARGVDESMSLEFVQYLVQQLTGWGYGRSYYGDRDAVPGKNIFVALNHNVRVSSRTIVVVSPGFLKNSWPKYCKQRAFEFLTAEENWDQLVLICLNLKLDELPEAFDDVPNRLCFSSSTYKNTDDIHVESEWLKLKTAFNGVQGEMPIKTSSKDDCEYQKTNFSTKTYRKTFVIPTATVDISETKPQTTEMVALETSVSLITARKVSLPTKSTNGDYKNKLSNSEVENREAGKDVNEVMETAQEVKALESQIIVANPAEKEKVHPELDQTDGTPHDADESDKKVQSSTSPTSNSLHDINESSLVAEVSEQSEASVNGYDQEIVETPPSQVMEDTQEQPVSASIHLVEETLPNTSNEAVSDEVEHTINDVCSPTFVDSGVEIDSNDVNRQATPSEDMGKPQKTRRGFFTSFNAPDEVQVNGFGGMYDVSVKSESMVRVLFRYVITMLARPELAYQ